MPFPYSTLAILGAGESGVGAAMLALKHGLKVILSDSSPISTALQNQLKEYVASGQLTLEGGGHSEEAILACQAVVKSPGIDPNLPIVQAALFAGLPVIDELELAGYVCRGKRLCITGSNGKTTTTLLIYHLLQQAGVSVGLAGNIGKSLAYQLAAGADPDWWVLEVSSFQLEGMPSFRPDISLLLNVTPDHLDRYGTIDVYRQVKLRLFGPMPATGTAICFADDPVLLSLAQDLLPPNLILFGSEPAGSLPQTRAWVTDSFHENGGEMLHLSMPGGTILLPTQGLPLLGKHNYLNMCAAMLAAATVTGNGLELLHHLATFQNAPHRMEQVGNLAGVRYINDSKATNLDSVRYALSAVEYPIVWIAGGKDKGNDYSQIADLVRSRVKALICLTHYPEPLQAAFGAIIPNIQVTESVTDAVAIARYLASPGEVVLLSPACASFDLFKNYEDRGNQFRNAVHALLP
jgi:UDP-N-acetylmuramoylalanine--D-glutamate ligase